MTSLRVVVRDTEQCDLLWLEIPSRGMGAQCDGRTGAGLRFRMACTDNRRSESGLQELAGRGGSCRQCINEHVDWTDLGGSRAAFA